MTTPMTPSAEVMPVDFDAATKCALMHIKYPDPHNPEEGNLARAYVALLQRAEKAEARAKELHAALEIVQFGFNHRRCSACAGWNMGPYGETDLVHTKDCIVGKALSVPHE